MPDGSWADNLLDTCQLIREIGWRDILLSTAGGQTLNPTWVEEELDTLLFLTSNGIPEPAIQQMTRHTPAQLLNLPPV